MVNGNIHTVTKAIVQLTDIGARLDCAKLVKKTATSYRIDYNRQRIDSAGYYGKN